MSDMWSNVDLRVGTKERSVKKTVDYVLKNMSTIIGLTVDMIQGTYMTTQPLSATMTKFGNMG